MRMRAILITTALLATAAAATVAPAAAEVEKYADPVGDTRQIQQERGPRQAADVVRTRVEHARTTVEVRLELVDLGGSVYTELRLRTSDRSDYLVRMYRNGRGEPKTLELVGGTGEVACPGLVGAFRDEEDVTRISIPRPCLGGPRWVRTGASAAASDEGFGRVFADDSRLDGDVRDDYRPVLGTERLARD
ncbi:hypothetical protein [uncultured Nocardioides sp.]|uniref:hypothetical protein n=1 Tax=uncultured Nocardioides sp. TaxID=198441 RepID=UPI002609A9B1|nr:hypothetical protein [uncultured Nocardioides sp.]